jgi:hypothetical protein
MPPTTPRSECTRSRSGPPDTRARLVDASVAVGADLAPVTSTLGAMDSRRSRMVGAGIFPAIFGYLGRVHPYPPSWRGSGTGSISIAREAREALAAPVPPLGLTGRLAEACQRFDLTQPYRPRGASTTRLTTATAGLMPWSGWFGRNVATNQICSMVGGPVASCSRTAGFSPWAAS